VQGTRLIFSLRILYVKLHDKISVGWTLTVKKTLLDIYIIEIIGTHYGIEVNTLLQLPLGADTYADVYRAVTPEQQSYFVKITTNGHPRSIAIFDLLQKVGIKNIISPVKTKQGDSSLQLEDATVIVYPFIDGQDGFSQKLSDYQWQTLGKILRQLHDVRVPVSLLPLIHRETYAPTWRNAVARLFALARLDPEADEIAVKLWAFIKANLAAIKRLVDRADHLANQLRHENLPFVLCHADIHAGNILIDQAESIYLVDWDAPIMAPKERDLMFIGGGVGNTWNDPAEVTRFYSGYGSTEINKNALAYYRHERIVEDIAIYSQAILFTSAKKQDKQQSYAHFKAMFAPRGVVEIAFNSDER
jgi:spectinomycin phosphotransferase